MLTEENKMRRPAYTNNQQTVTGSSEYLANLLGGVNLLLAWLVIICGGVAIISMLLGGLAQGAFGVSLLGVILGRIALIVMVAILFGGFACLFVIKQHLHHLSWAAGEQANITERLVTLAEEKMATPPEAD